MVTTTKSTTYRSSDFPINQNISQVRIRVTLRWRERDVGNATPLLRKCQHGSTIACPSYFSARRPATMLSLRCPVLCPARRLSGMFRPRSFHYVCSYSDDAYAIASFAFSMMCSFFLVFFFIYLLRRQ